MMKGTVVAGILLVVAGVLALIFQGIPYTENREVVDLGPLEIEAREERTLPLPPILGGLAIAGGVILIVAGSRRQRIS